ncbi:MAG: hypothetical protein LBR94_05695 [Desulfovibrio sp.]|jgi:hypothetical protein|nr:hypothetical protein [Desulfovibrio sp.]
MLTKAGMDTADEALRSALIAKQEDLKLSDERLGRQAFGYLKAPRGKIQSLFVGQGQPGKRKPQTINIWELINLCEAMGLDWEKEIRKAKKSAEVAQKSPS